MLSPPEPGGTSENLTEAKRLQGFFEKIKGNNRSGKTGQKSIIGSGAEPSIQSAEGEAGQHHDIGIECQLRIARADASRSDRIRANRDC